MEAKYILEYSNFPTQKVLSKIDESEKEITDAFTGRKVLQQGYQSELRTLFKPITEEIKKLSVSSLQNKLTTVTNKIEKLKQAEIGATQESTDILKESISKLRDQQTRIVSILDSIKESSEMKDMLILISKRPNVKRWLAEEDVELE